MLKRPKFLLYRDPKYGFTLRLPAWWKSYIVVKREDKLIDAEYGVSFLFKYRGKVYGEVLTLLVYQMTLKEWKENGYEESPVVLLAEGNGRLYAYLLPEELPDDFLSPDGQDYDYKKYGRPIRLMKRMVNHDAPVIVKSLRLAEAGGRTRCAERAQPSPPLRSSKIWPYRP